MSNVTVFGTGSFGTALANVLAENGHQVLMWGKNEQTINDINKQHKNTKALTYCLSKLTLFNYPI